MSKITITPKEALSKIMHWCSKMERSRYDVSNKLYSWGIDKNGIEEIIQKLQDEGFLDTGRYMEAFIKGKLYYNKWGKVKIKHHLKVKGFKEQDIDKYLDELIDEETYMQMIFEQLQRKNASITEDDEYARKSKIINFGQSRGYETELALQCVDKIVAR